MGRDQSRRGQVFPESIVEPLQRGGGGDGGMFFHLLASDQFGTVPRRTYQDGGTLASCATQGLGSHVEGVRGVVGDHTMHL